MSTKPYRKPYGPMIGRGDATEKLYALEDKTIEAFRKSATELGVILGLTDFYHEIMPEALLSFLDCFDNEAVRLAIETWQERDKEKQKK